MNRLIPSLSFYVGRRNFALKELAIGSFLGPGPPDVSTVQTPTVVDHKAMTAQRKVKTEKISPPPKKGRAGRKLEPGLVKKGPPN